MEMRNPLQPSTTLEMLDRTFRIYRDSFMTFIVPVAVVTVPITIITVIGSTLYAGRFADLQIELNRLAAQSRSAANNTALQREIMGLTGEAVNSLIVFFAIIAVISLIQVVLVNGIITYIASENHLGRRTHVAEAFNVVRERLLPLTGGMLLGFLMMVVIGVGLGLTLFLCGLGIGLLVYISLALFSLLPAVIILERTTVGLGLRRAWSLGKARIWQILGITIAIGVINYVVALGLTTLVTIFSLDTSAVSLDAADIINVIFQAIINIILLPVPAIAFTLLYYDARVRLEGLDIAMNEAGYDVIRPSDLESPRPTDPLMSGKDFSNLLILSVGFLVIACALTTIIGSIGQLLG